MNLFAQIKGSSLSVFSIVSFMVERETGRKLKCLRFDNRGEYTSRVFGCKTFVHVAKE